MRMRGVGGRGTMVFVCYDKLDANKYHQRIWVLGYGCVFCIAVFDFYPGFRAVSIMPWLLNSMK